jgi:hypothetical protein
MKREDVMQFAEKGDIYCGDLQPGVLLLMMPV